MRVLVTGITGFAGSHLADVLSQEPAIELFGTSRSSRSTTAGQHVKPCDLTNPAAVEELIRETRPEQIYHLAGYAHAGESLRDPKAAWAGNLTATLNLYDAVQRWGGKTRILFVGSGLIYGDPETPGQAQDERTVLKPASPYASSKAAADLASYQYTRSNGLDIVRARPFNHIGPRQSPHYAVAHFAQQIAAIEQGRQEPVLLTGNLAARRDFSDVRDMVNAYTLLMERGRTGEAYNIGSGTAVAVQEVLDQLLRLSKAPIKVQQKGELLRKTETDVVCADATKIRRETTWQPRFTLEQTLSDALDYWRGLNVGSDRQ
jgi:GDP-4-dehydro-6-deoxy-D-mannose reductase